MGNPMSALDIAHKAEKQGYGAIISRGTTSRIMSGSGISIPVIQVKVTGYDAVRAPVSYTHLDVYKRQGYYR